MTTIINETFPNGSSVSMDMDKDASELFVFYFHPELACETKKYSLNSYDMAQALAQYEMYCATEYQRMNDEA